MAVAATLLLRRMPRKVVDDPLVNPLASERRNDRATQLPAAEQAHGTGSSIGQNLSDGCAKSTYDINRVSSPAWAERQTQQRQQALTAGSYLTVTERAWLGTFLVQRLAVQPQRAYNMSERPVHP